MSAGTDIENSISYTIWDDDFVYFDVYFVSDTTGCTVVYECGPDAAYCNNLENWSTISFEDNTDHFSWSFYTYDEDNSDYFSGDYPVTITGSIEGHEATANSASVTFTLQIRNRYCSSWNENM